MFDLKQTSLRLRRAAFGLGAAALTLASMAQPTAAAGLPHDIQVIGNASYKLEDGSVLYRFTVRNNGPVPVDNIHVHKHTKRVDAPGLGIHSTYSDHQTIKLDAHQEMHIKIVCKEQPGTICEQATMRAVHPQDPTPNNNSATLDAA